MAEPLKITAPCIPLIRTFRSDQAALPTFLQDILLDWVDRVPCQQISRLIEILKSVQFSLRIDSFDQGKLWYCIRDILRKNLLADEHLFRDGRDVRSLVLQHMKHGTQFRPMVSKVTVSPNRRRQELNIFTPKAQGKFELLR